VANNESARVRLYTAAVRKEVEKLRGDLDRLLGKFTAAEVDDRLSSCGRDIYAQLLEARRIIGQTYALDFGENAPRVLGTYIDSEVPA